MSHFNTSRKKKIEQEEEKKERKESDKIWQNYYSATIYQMMYLTPISRCDDGYYGDVANGGVCEPCLCNALGSVGVCNKTDGACNCLPGVAGHHCDECAERYVVSVEGCMCK